MFFSSRFRIHKAKVYRIQRDRLRDGVGLEDNSSGMGRGQFVDMV